MAQTAEVQARLVTADELLRMSRGRVRRELIRGELRTMPLAGAVHGRVAATVAARLAEQVWAHGLGEVLAAGTGFQLEWSPDTVRAPDGAFIRRERVEEVGDTEGYWPGAPDLAVEVVSPGDTFSEVEGKVFDWLDAGTRMGIVANPKKCTATVYRSRSEITVFTEEDELDGADVVPGWRLPLREIFS